MYLIDTLKVAREVEERYSKYVNTDDANFHEIQNQIRRMHPVNSLDCNNQMDLNHMVEEVDNGIITQIKIEIYST